MTLSILRFSTGVCLNCGRSPLSASKRHDAWLRKRCSCAALEQVFFGLQIHTKNLYRAANINGQIYPKDLFFDGVVTCQVIDIPKWGQKGADLIYSPI